MHDWIEKAGSLETAAAAIAPAIRALFGREGQLLVSFSATAAATNRQTIIIEDTSGLETIYSALQKAAAEQKQLQQINLKGIDRKLFYS